MQFFSRKLLGLALAVTIIVAMLMPTTTAHAAQGSAVSYPELTPEMEQYMEREYWVFTVAKAIVYTQGEDGFSKREAVQIAAINILEEFDCYPGGEKGDVAAREWQRHWGNFFDRIAQGNFTDRELRRAFRTWRARQHHTRHRHRTTGIRGVRYKAK